MIFLAWCEIEQNNCELLEAISYLRDHQFLKGRKLLQFSFKLFCVLSKSSQKLFNYPPKRSFRSGRLKLRISIEKFSENHQIQVNLDVTNSTLPFKPARIDQQTKRKNLKNVVISFLSINSINLKSPLVKKKIKIT